MHCASPAVCLLWGVWDVDSRRFILESRWHCGAVIPLSQVVVKVNYCVWYWPFIPRIMLPNMPDSSTEDPNRGCLPKARETHINKRPGTSPSPFYRTSAERPRPDSGVSDRCLAGHNNPLSYNRTLRLFTSWLLTCKQLIAIA